MSIIMTTTKTGTIWSLPKTTMLVSHRPQPKMAAPASTSTATTTTTSSSSPAIQLSNYPFTTSPYGPPTLLTLPLELRLQIYNHLLTYTELSEADCSPKGYKPQVHPAILSVCRQTHAEAHELLYTRNTFQAHDALLTGFPRLRPGYGGFVTSGAMAGLVRRFALRVRLDVKPRFTRAAAAASFSGAERLDLDVWQAQFRCAGRDVLSLFEDVRGVGRVAVTGSVGGFETYVRWLECQMMRPLGEALGEMYTGEEGDVSMVDVLC
jgi:hypothetical protein